MNKVQVPTSNGGTAIINADDGSVLSNPSGGTIDSTAIAAAVAGAANGYLDLHRNGVPTTAKLKTMFGPTAIGSGDDIIVDQLYDTVALTASTVNNFKFFTASSYLGDGYRNNMTQNGALPSDEAFLITSIRFEFWGTGVAATTGAWIISDIKSALFTMYYSLIISNKPYNNGYGFQFVNPNAQGFVNTNIMALNPFRSWNLAIPIAVPPRVNFVVSGSTTPGAFTDSVNYLKAILGGYHYRAVQ